MWLMSAEEFVTDVNISKKIQTKNDMKMRAEKDTVHCMPYTCSSQSNGKKLSIHKKKGFV